MENEWQDGCLFEEAPYSKGKLAFRQPIQLSIRLVDQWEAQLIRPGREVLMRNGVELEPDDQIVSYRHEDRTMAIEGVFDLLGDTALRLLRSPSHRLSDADLDLKSLLISCLDLLESEVGLSFPKERWLLMGREGDKLVAKSSDESFQAELPSFEVAEGELMMCKVKVHKCGSPIEGEPILEVNRLNTTNEFEALLRIVRKG